MIDKAAAPAQARKTRRPYIWQPSEPPRLADLFAGPEKRRRLLAYGFGEGLLNLRDRFLFALFAALPPGFASRLGGRVGQFAGPRKYPELHRKLRRNLKIIRPDLDQAGRDRLALDFFDNYGRVIAEFALLRRLDKAGRVHHRNGAAIKALQAQGPVILLGLHLANWEAIFPVFAQLGIAPATVYKPPERAAQLRIAIAVRKSLGANLLPPGIAGARPALRVLQGGGILCLFGDEEHEGRTMAPFFGQTPHLNGNLAIAARLARMSGAQIVVFHGERRPNSDYVMIFENPTPLPSQTDPKAPLLDDVVALNAAIEPIIREHCGNWYFLSHLQLPRSGPSDFEAVMTSWRPNRVGP